MVGHFHALYELVDLVINLYLRLGVIFPSVCITSPEICDWSCVSSAYNRNYLSSNLVVRP